MAKQPPWKIRAGRKAEILADFYVPAHKLPRKALFEYLKAMVVRYRTDTPEDMLSFYVSKRRGTPYRLPFANVRYSFDCERRQVGYFCGDWECYASAMQEIEPDAAEALMKELEKNKKAMEIYNDHENYSPR